MSLPFFLLSEATKYDVTCGCPGSDQYNQHEGYCYSCGYESPLHVPRTIVIFFRGRNTDHIIRDALTHLACKITVGNDNYMSVCRRDMDSLADISDQTVEQVIHTIRWFSNPETSIYVVANGGTTEQLLGIISGLKTLNKSAVFLDCQPDRTKEYVL